MTILPDPVPIDAETRTTRRLSRVDGCPRCLNYESPIGVRDLEGGFRTTYWCHSCDHRWYTSWSDE